MTGQTPPPTWYGDPVNPERLRWWDGNQWTEHTKPPPHVAPAPIQLPPKDRIGSYPAARPADTSYGRLPSWLKRKRMLIPAGLLAVGAVGSLADDRGEETTAGLVAEADEPEAIVLFGQTAEPSERSLPLASTSRSTTLSTRLPTTQATRQPTEAPTTTAAPTTSLAPTIQPTSAPTETTPTTTAPTTTAPTTTAPTTQATPAPTEAPTSTAAPVTQPEAQAVVDCHPAYSGCLPNLPGDALNCGDVAQNTKPVTVYDVAVDPYRLDGDNDGFGCEP